MESVGLGGETLQDVAKVLASLRLPVPDHENEFLKANRGAILFSNYYGVTVRIEEKVPLLETYDNAMIVRLPDYPLMIQPIARMDAGHAVIEICPGTNLANDRFYADHVWRVMFEGGLDFFDDGIHNVGLLPVKTKKYPEGIPVVIDRLSVLVLTERSDRVKQALKTIGCKEDPQNIYAPLRKAFKKASGKDNAANPKKINSFWQQCRKFKRQGKLIAGWNQDRYDRFKLYEPRKAAKAYDKAMGLN